jgi:hypothetical protein
MVFFRSRHLGRTLILVVMLCSMPLILQIVNSYRSSFTGGADYASTTIRLSGYAYFLSHAFDGGLFVQQALTVASHHIQSVAPVTITDLFLY